MTKQTLLDKENPTPTEAVSQQLLMSTSMTRLKEIGRVIREVEGKLYKTSMKTLPFTDVVKAIETAILLSQDVTIEDEKPYTQPGQTGNKSSVVK